MSGVLFHWPSWADVKGLILTVLVKQTFMSSQDDEVSTADNAPMFSSNIPGMAPEDRVESGPTPAKRLNIPGKT